MTALQLAFCSLTRRLRRLFIWRRMRTETRFDYLLVGGGLQNALVALAILHERPSARVALIESSARLGGNHTWCCHEADVVPECLPWLDPLFVARWAQHDVMFPSRERRLAHSYYAVSSERLNEVVSSRLEGSLNARRVHGAATSVTAHSVALSDGVVLEGELVVDARGPQSSKPVSGACYQKFLGLEFCVPSGTAPALPTLMDATVEQFDGFRFVYVLPLAADRVLVEDTYYSEDPSLDAPLLRSRVESYARRVGLRPLQVAREERGVLPLPLRVLPPCEERSPLVAGYAGGFFHPTTGYSFPLALRLAHHLSTRPPEQAFDVEFRRMTRAQRQQQRLCVWLNRLLFTAFQPDKRYHVLERFYGLPDDTIQRFYALQMTGLDRVRILCGRPPRGFSTQRFLSGTRPLFTRGHTA